MCCDGVWADVVLVCCEMVLFPLAAVVVPVIARFMLLTWHTSTRHIMLCVVQALMKACGGQKNVVELIEFEEYGSEMYFVMEYCPSTLLKSILEENEVMIHMRWSCLGETIVILAMFADEGCQMPSCGAHLTLPMVTCDTRWLHAGIVFCMHDVYDMCALALRWRALLWAT